MGTRCTRRETGRADPARKRSSAAVVVVAARIDPVVGLRQAEFLRRALEADVDAEVADARLDGREQPVVAVYAARLLREQVRESVHRASVRDHAVRQHLAAVRHAHAAHCAHAAGTQQYFLDTCVGEDLTARRADARQDRLRNARRAAHRIEAAVQVVPCHQRLHHERRALRRQAQVAPLAGQHRDQFGVLT